jgi:hypothetical protein
LYYSHICNSTRKYFTETDLAADDRTTEQHFTEAGSGRQIRPRQNAGEGRWRVANRREKSRLEGRGWGRPAPERAGEREGKSGQREGQRERETGEMKFHFSLGFEPKQKENKRKQKK